MRILLVTLFWSLCLEVSADVESVSFAGGIEGKLELPDGGSQERAVLFLHGWNGTMDEVGNLYADLAAALKARGIASLRFNYSGEGERVGYVVTSTLGSRLRESRAAFEYLREKTSAETYGVVGFSLGGLTAMELVGQEPDWFSSMVLWSAAQEMRLSGDESYNNAVREAVDTGRGTYRSYADITLTRDYVLSFLGVNSSVHLPSYPGSLLAIRGDDDFLPTHDPDWLKAVPTRDKAFLMIGGADHIFNVLEDPRPNYGHRVIEATAAWLDRTLKSD